MFDVAGRRVVRVVAGDGHPVLGARVVVGGDRPLLDARTHSDGRVLFLPKATEGAGDGPWPVTVDAGGVNVNESTNYWESHLPFGGRAGSRSGVGRVGGRYAMETFTELKTVIVSL